MHNAAILRKYAHFAFKFCSIEEIRIFKKVSVIKKTAIRANSVDVIRHGFPKKTKFWWRCCDRRMAAERWNISRNIPQQKIVFVVFESHMLKKIAQTGTVECRS